MKRKLGFRLFKTSLRGVFFSVYWSTKMMSRFVKYLHEVKEDAMTDKGNCPDCKSYDIEYYTPEVVENNRVRMAFNCSKCGKHGHEFYRLRYLKSFMAKVEVDNGEVRQAVPDSIRTAETN